MCGRQLGVAPALVQLLRGARQTPPLWLEGMAHVAGAREDAQMAAIVAGGGSAEGFAEEDFRSSAARDSWGFERDLSFASFDEKVRIPQTYRPTP